MRFAYPPYGEMVPDAVGALCLPTLQNAQSFSLVRWVRYAYPPYKVGNPDVSVGRVSEAHSPDNIFTTFT